MEILSGITIDASRLFSTPAASGSMSIGSPWDRVTVDDASSAIGDLLYKAADGHWDRCDPNAKVSSMGVAIAAQAGAGTKLVMLPGGIFRLDTWTWTPGAILYADAVTPGALTETAPGSGDYVVPVAIALTATTVYLCPSLKTPVSLTRNSVTITLEDDGEYDLPANSCGSGRVVVGDSEEYADFIWDSSEVVTLVVNSANVDDADTDTFFCIFDNTGKVTLKNRLGVAKEIMVDYISRTP